LLAETPCIIYQTILKNLNNVPQTHFLIMIIAAKACVFTSNIKVILKDQCQKYGAKYSLV
jgi:hypothetical protein